MRLIFNRKKNGYMKISRFTVHSNENDLIMYHLDRSSAKKKLI